MHHKISFDCALSEHFLGALTLVRRLIRVIVFVMDIRESLLLLMTSFSFKIALPICQPAIMHTHLLQLNSWIFYLEACRLNEEDDY